MMYREAGIGHGRNVGPQLPHARELAGVSVQAVGLRHNSPELSEEEFVKAAKPAAATSTTGDATCMG